MDEPSGLKDVPLQSPESPSSDSEDMFSVASTPASTPCHEVKKEQVNGAANIDSLNQLMNEKDALKIELQNVKLDIDSLAAEFKQSRDEVRNNLLGKLEQVAKSRDAAKKDLESMVIKYAMSEKSVIEAKKAKDASDAKLREILKDRDSLLARIKSLNSDKNGLISALDRKLLDHANSLKELDKLNTELKEKDAKLKHANARLAHAIEAQDESKEQLQSLNKVLHILKKELETCKMNTAALEREINTRENQSDHGNESPQGEVVQSIEGEVEAQVTTKCIPEIIVTGEGVNKLTCDDCPRLRGQVDEYKGKISSLESSLSEKKSTLERLRSQLEETNLSTQKSINEKTAEIEKLLKVQLTLENDLSEVKAECEVLRSRENELTDLTENLKEKLKKSQQEHAHCQDIIRSHLESLESTNLKIKEQEGCILKLEEQLQAQIESSKSLTKEYECKLQAKTKQLQSLNCKIEELENDKRIMSKKHSNSLKELQKELSLARRKLMDMDSSSHASSNHETQPQVNSQNSMSEPIGTGMSRSSSSTSMDAVSQDNSHSSKEPKVNGSCKMDNEGSIEVPSNLLSELDKQKLVERILKLQKTLARRSEKMDFLEDNNHQLVEELKKKTRLIQHYLLREESGALTTNAMDVNKVSFDHFFL